MEEQVEALVTAARDALDAHDAAASVDALQALAPLAAEVDPVDSVDLVERACCYGMLPAVEAAYEALGPFVFDAWALALSLRCAHEDVARWMLARGVDLLGNVRTTLATRRWLPHEGRFTRFDFTRSAPTLLKNPMDPTVASEVFNDFKGTEQLTGGPFLAEFDLEAACACVARIACEGVFEDTVYDDLFRAVTIRAWHALRHAGSRDEDVAATCFDLGSQLWAWHRDRGLGDERLDRIMGDLVVPRADEGVFAFVCENAPEVFLDRLVTTTWLAEEPELVRSMVAHLAPGDAEGNGALVLLLAKNGYMAELRQVGRWPGMLDLATVDRAMGAASAAGHAEVVAWLLSRRAELAGGSAPQTSTLHLLL